MLSAFPFKHRQVLGLMNVVKCLNNSRSYSTCKNILCNQRISHYLTSKTSTVQKCYLRTSNNLKYASGKGATVDYNGIVEAQKDSSVLIIDIREVGEIQKYGQMPGSIHIPMARVGYELKNLSEEDFKRKYKRDKPTHDTKIILSCQSGKRSALVQANMIKAGYKNSVSYAGGWLDWKKHQKS